MKIRDNEPISAQIVAKPEQPGASYAQAFYPWRRYWARMFDLAVYDLLWSAVLAAVFHTNLAARGVWGGLFDGFIALLLMLLFEPLWLCWLVTTPGKALWGLRLRTLDSKFLSYRQSAART